MLLTRLANSNKATFWTSPIRNLGEGSLLLASEASSGDHANGTTLDWVLINASHDEERVVCTLSLTDEAALDVLAESGIELDNIDQANATLANIIVGSCEKNGVLFEVRESTNSVIVHLKDKIGGVTIDVKLEAKVVLNGSGLPTDILRVFDIFHREPRKETRKRSSQSQTLSTQEATQGSQQTLSPIVLSNVSQVVKAKRKKGLKI